MTESSNLFVELLQFCLGTRDCLSCLPNADGWRYLFEESQRQALPGIFLEGIHRLSIQDSRLTGNLPKELMLQWIGLALQIEQRNALTTKVCGEVVGQMEKDGMRCCVLKGQANHRYYPEKMANLRSCGDVDVWVCSVKDSRFMAHSDVGRVLEYVDAHWKRTGLCWLHCIFIDKSGVPVEVHFHPSFFSRPKYFKRFITYFSDFETCIERVSVDGVEIPAMRVEKDVIYQMNHIYRHLIDEGVGLRQIVDYYWLLRRFFDERLTVIDKAKVMEILSWLGMRKFAGALMYVMKELLGMPSKYLLCEPSEKDGEFLMNEILLSGNFGHNDSRMGDVLNGGYLKSRISQASRRFKRNMRFFTSYPGEVIWEPIVRVGHYIWKKLRLWRY